MPNSNSSDTLTIPGSYPTDDILYVRNPNGTLEPLLSASGAYLPALIAPDAPLLTEILAAEKLAVEKEAKEKKAAEEEERKKKAETEREKTEEVVRKAPGPLVWEDEEAMQGMQWWYFDSDGKICLAPHIQKPSTATIVHIDIRKRSASKLAVDNPQKYSRVIKHLG
ncbi:hypothetical protein K440DRAFT_642685 [Wilcoxina mikolae CBS 423.85]|nr:hypothetical protein K440DRAFT_642685 [Wilcoxina mikolae CBS 423.85]